MAESVVLRAERMVAGGAALGHEESGRVVFVDGALPGEQVLARVVDEKADYARATVLDVLDPSPARREPPCRHAREGCGGCGWQHIDPLEQLTFKRMIVQEALRRTARLPDVMVHPGVPLDPWAFRTTLRLAACDDGRLAFRGWRSHDLVVVQECLVAHPLLAELVPIARCRGAKELMLRCSAATGERMAVAIPGRRRAALPPDVAQGPHAHIHEVVAGRRLKVSGHSFFQTRADGAAALVAAVRAAAGGAVTTMVDAYSGVGLFGATLGLAERVIAVERSPSSCRDARVNLQGRGEVRCVAVEEWTSEPAELVVADPARVGLGRAGAAALAGTGAPTLVLVSCDPVALARDAALLGAYGFRHAGSTLVDLFPHTPHIEVVTRFERN